MIDISSGECILKGDYYFRNDSPESCERLIFYPLIDTGDLPFPYFISVTGLYEREALNYKISKDGITFTLKVSPYDTKVIRIEYHQKIKGNKFEYILTTTSYWQKPLKRADFLISLPKNSVLLDRFFFSALRKGQSWCLSRDWYYRDNSPTFGQPNDTLNAMGQITGSVTDTVGNPIEGIAAYWDHATTWPENTLALDSSGHFSIRVLASSITFTFQKENYDFIRAYVSAYPESTITVHFTLKSQSPNSVAGHFNEQLRNYSLADNYPNPFNGSTFFSYQIAHDEFVEVNMYDLMGRLVENLFSGFQTKGEHRLMWDAFSAPSGIYIYRLRTPHVTINKKCVRIK